MNIGIQNNVITPETMTMVQQSLNSENILVDSVDKILELKSSTGKKLM